jgi:hypothetical protein
MVAGDSKPSVMVMLPKTCQKCGETKPETAFRFDRTKSNPHRRDTTCNTCNNAIQKAWREANKPAYNRRIRERRKERGETYKEIRRQWSQKNRERNNAREREKYAANPEPNLARNARWRARKRGATINDLSAAQWKEIKAAYDHRCVYCGRKMKRLTQDHLLPLSRGGTNTVANVVPACLSCNSRKYTGPPLIPVQPLLLTLAKPFKKRKSHK